MSEKLLLVLVSSVWTQASVVAVQQRPSSYHPLEASSPKVQPPIVASFGDLNPRPHSKEKGAKFLKSNHDNGAFELLLLLLIQKRK
jgi:hypothetical protein